MTYVHETALLDSNVSLGENVKIWARTHVRENCIISANVIVGESVYIGPGVAIGANSKIQNQAQIYEPSEIGEGVFIGPSAILTNDNKPRATDENGAQKASSEWTKEKVIVEDGCSIGAGAVCVAPVRLGRFSMVAAGSVVVRDVPAHSLVAGNPAKHIRWIDEQGNPLIEEADGSYLSSAGKTYVKTNSGLTALS